MEKLETRWLLFIGSQKDESDGAQAFWYASDYLPDAQAEGLRYMQDATTEGSLPLSQWAHIASFDGKELTIVSKLNIPGTEQAQSDVMEWREVQS
jgi:hypothetical protein